MQALNDLPVWALALLIFGCRVVDVSMGTLRTITVVQGRIRLSVVLGFFEVLVWITAVSQVITGVKDSPVLLLAYAAGFATGNAVGILLERRLALGAVVVRIISIETGNAIANALRADGWALTTFLGEGRDGPVTLIYLTCPRRELDAILVRARAVDPEVFYAVEMVREWSRDLGHPLPLSTGWRAAFQRK
jgi:uncharacterized protein YebE (UPF0316 family)